MKEFPLYLCLILFEQVKDLGHKIRPEKAHLVQHLIIHSGQPEAPGTTKAWDEINNLPSLLPPQTFFVIFKDIVPVNMEIPCIAITGN